MKLEKNLANDERIVYDVYELSNGTWIMTWERFDRNGNVTKKSQSESKYDSKSRVERVIGMKIEG